MSHKQISSREEIEAFLHDLIRILNAPEFNIDSDLDVLQKEIRIPHRSVYNRQYPAGTRV